MTYFGTRLSPHLSRREPEGYLICTCVPVARTGVQEYLPSELGLPLPDSRMIPVIRPEEEVFAAATMASFEGMPVTDGHPLPPEGVTAENIRTLQKGHAHNIRRGTGAESDLLLADLIITDPDLITRILNGKREISCGYNYLLSEEEGKYIQRGIRGNHVAVVDAGRAGPRVSIKDERFARTQPTNERSKSIMKNQRIVAALARMVRDSAPEEATQILGEILEAATESVPENTPENISESISESIPAEASSGERATDCQEAILGALDRIIALLEHPAGRDCADPARAMDEEETGAEMEMAAGAAEAAGKEMTAAAESAGEAAESAEAAALAAAAMAQALHMPDAETGTDDDPVDELVAEILETMAADEPENPEEVLSTVLEPEEESTNAADEEDPDLRAADALRAALSVFRPQLKRMSPRERKRFNTDVSARIRQTSGVKSAGGYIALNRSAAQDRSARDLGQRIMAGRNANYSK